jgi:hypothetical protein
MTISIWAQQDGQPAEKIDQASSRREAAYLAGEYRMAYGQGWRVWAGRKDGTLPEKKKRLSYWEHKREQQTLTGHWTASM